jgi:hypothetical protein
MQTVEGIVLDVGWYRTTIRSFEREVFVIPNAVFSKNTVLNVTRKMREWRFYEFLCVRVQDVHKVNAIIQVGPGWGWGRLIWREADYDAWLAGAQRGGPGQTAALRGHIRGACLHG